MDIDVWRCFSFLNDVRNMRAVAETVMKRGRLFQPTISFTAADWATDAYYLGVVRDIVEPVRRHRRDRPLHQGHGRRRQHRRGSAG